MGTGCVVKYGPVSIVSGTTIYYQVADSTGTPPGNTSYLHGSNTTTTCPTSAASICVGSFVVTAITTRSLTATNTTC
jgi:hypothetical protein